MHIPLAQPPPRAPSQPPPAKDFQHHPRSPSYPPASSPALPPTSAPPSTTPHDTDASAAPGFDARVRAVSAEEVNRFGRRNVDGFIVFGVLALAGLALWLAFGALPRRAWRRLRSRGLARGRSAAEARTEEGPGKVEAVQRGPSRGVAGRKLDGAGRVPGTAQADREDASSVEDKDGEACSGGSPKTLSEDLPVDTLEKGLGDGGERTHPQLHFA